MTQKGKQKTEQVKSFEESVIEILEKMDKRGEPGLDQLIAELRANYGGTKNAESSVETESVTPGK